MRITYLAFPTHSFTTQAFVFATAPQLPALNAPHAPVGMPKSAKSTVATSLPVLATASNLSENV